MASGDSATIFLAGTVVPGAASTPTHVDRNLIVKLFGTPDDTDGSANEARGRRENGEVFNEVWVYRRLRHEATRPRERRVYWNRYDFIASERVERDGTVVEETVSDLLARAVAPH